jgi:hypothetical protein
MRFGSTLDDALTSIGPGKKVLRTWFFQGSAIDWDTNQRDWSAFDHTLQVADAHGMKVVATLTDEWGECGTHVGGSPENGIKYEPWSGKPGHARSRQLRGAERAVPDDPRSPRDRHV